MDWSSFQRTGLCLLCHGMLLGPTIVRSGFPLVYSCLKDPERACLEHFTVLLAGDRLVDSLISKPRGFMVSFWRVASWKGSVEKSTFSFIFRLNLRLQASQLNWGC